MRQTNVTVNGKEFKLQSIPYRSYLEINDKNTNKKGMIEKAGYVEDLLKHCVIEPRVTLESFDDDYSTGTKLANEIESFLATPDKPKKDKTKSEE